MATPELDMANLLLDCLQEQFNYGVEDLATPLNWCLRAGENVAEDIDPLIGVDLCCEGLGWVRPGIAFPSSDFPTPDPVTTKCLPVAWAQEYEVGLLGCYPGMGEASMPTCVDHTAAALADMARIQVLKRTMCCFDAALQANPRTRGRLYTIQAIEVQGPRGTCISRVMRILVQLPRCC